MFVKEKRVMYREIYEGRNSPGIAIAANSEWSRLVRFCCGCNSFPGIKVFNDATNRNATNNPGGGGLHGFPTDPDTPARKHGLPRARCRERERRPHSGCEQRYRSFTDRLRFA